MTRFEGFLHRGLLGMDDCVMMTQRCPDGCGGTVRFHSAPTRSYVGSCDGCGGRYELVAWPEHWREPTGSSRDPVVVRGSTP